MEALDKNIVINYVIPFLTYKERVKLYSTCSRFWAMNTGEYIHSYCWEKHSQFKILFTSYELTYFKNQKFNARFTLVEYNDGGSENSYINIEEINVKALLKDYMYHFKDSIPNKNKRIKRV